MDETMRMWLEILFNVAYLVVIWLLVAAMARRQHDVWPGDRPVARLLTWAFGLLALGDTGHVGFRVLAYALGDLEATFELGGARVGLVGLGALSTALTVTAFYLLLLAAWQKRFNKGLGWFGRLLWLSALARLVLMVFPENQWNSAVPPQPWSLYRNLPLTLLGLGVALLMLRDAAARADRPFQRIGLLILVSYAFYLPVILWVQERPAVGMLMIPKTLAYLGMAAVVYWRLFRAATPTRREVRFSA